MAKYTIETRHIRPPSPTAKFDWQATLDNYDPGDPIGYGETEAAAVADLFDELEARKE